MECPECGSFDIEETIEGLFDCQECCIVFDDDSYVIDDDELIDYGEMEDR